MSQTQTQPPTALRLKPIEVAGFTRPIELANGRLSIGRADDNDLVLSAELFPSVSQHHCELVQVGDKLEISDRGSRNGTLVNGKAAKQAMLVPGDVIQLGAIGPRFLVTTSNPLAETMFVDPRQVGVGALTQVELKQALGVPEDVGVEELVKRGSRSNLLRLVLLVGLLAIVLVWAGRTLWQRGEADHARITALNDQLQDNQRKREEDRERLSHTFEQSRSALEATKTRLESEGAKLQERIDKLEHEGSTSAEELDNLRTELGDTRGELDNARDELRRFNPLDLEQSRLTDVARVRSAIVLLEAVTTIEAVQSGKTLYIREEDGEAVPNFEDEGEPVAFESTGSGFCISAEGYILTNAHVVLPSEDESALTSAAGMSVRQRVAVQAVFSGSDKRHPIEVVSFADDGEEDLALVRIEPFEGMPFIDGFDPDAALPDPGEDVYLFGFPLGNFALQQGDTVIASTFRGIVSRHVDGKLQVDAGVHPGNSGGPVTDASGRVIGVVTSVQALPDQSAVYAMGYVLPISDAKRLWPLPKQ